MKERNESSHHTRPKLVPLREIKPAPAPPAPPPVKIVPAPCRIPCNLCPETFFSESEYYTHKIIHVKEKNWMTALERLENSSDKVNKVKLTACEICKQVMPVSKMGKHKRLHTR